MSDFSRRIEASCPCCGFATLEDTTDWSYEICPVCFWENDPVQRDDPAYPGGANHVSLLQARGNFVRVGACSPEMTRHTRPPRLEEIPFLRTLRGLEQEQRTAAVRLRKAQMLAVLQGMRRGMMPALDGCGVIAMLVCGLAEEEISTDLHIFWVIAGEVEEFPQGAARDQWSPEALAHKDTERQEYEQRMRDEINTACEAAEKSLRNELNT